MSPTAPRSHPRPARPAAERPVRPALTAVVFAAAATALASVLAALPVSTGDYSVFAPVGVDNAAPAVADLAHFRLAALAAHQPLMGLTSLLVRAPAQALADGLGAGSLTAYRLGAIACLIPACLLASWLVVRSRAGTRRLVGAGAAAIVILAGPATRDALAVGHPEEVLAAALATAAVLAAAQSRHTPAAILLGAAIGTKQWALVAAPCVYVALGDRRVSTIVKAGAVGIVLTAALPLADLTAFHAASGVGGTHYTDAFSAWWPISPRYPGTVGSRSEAHQLVFGLTRSAAGALFIVLVAAVAACRVRLAGAMRAVRVDPLALLALAALVRCVGDPAALKYYFVALTIPLATWESAALDRLPIVSALNWISIALLFSPSVFAGLGPGADNALVLGWAAALGVYLFKRALGAPHPVAPSPDRRPLRAVVSDLS